MTQNLSLGGKRFFYWKVALILFFRRDRKIRKGVRKHKEGDGECETSPVQSAWATSASRWAQQVTKGKGCATETKLWRAAEGPGHQKWAGKTIPGTKDIFGHTVVSVRVLMTEDVILKLRDFQLFREWLLTFSILSVGKVSTWKQHSVTPLWFIVTSLFLVFIYAFLFKILSVDERLFC